MSYDMLKFLFPHVTMALSSNKTTIELRRNAVAALAMLGVILIGAAAVHFLFGVS
jgi:hypothetical protein